MIHIPVLSVKEISCDRDMEPGFGFGFREVLYIRLRARIVFHLDFGHGHCLHLRFVIISEAVGSDEWHVAKQCVQNLFDNKLYLKREYHMPNCNKSIEFDHTKFVFSSAGLDPQWKQLFETIFSSGSWNIQKALSAVTE